MSLNACIRKSRLSDSIITGIREKVQAGKAPHEATRTLIDEVTGDLEMVRRQLTGQGLSLDPVAIKATSGSTPIKEGVAPNGQEANQGRQGQTAPLLEPKAPAAEIDPSLVRPDAANARTRNRHLVEVSEHPDVRGFMDEPTAEGGAKASQVVAKKLTEVDQIATDKTKDADERARAEKARKALEGQQQSIFDTLAELTAEAEQTRRGPSARYGGYGLAEVVADALRGVGKEATNAARTAAHTTKAMWEIRKELADAVLHGSQRRNPRFDLGPKGEVNLSSPKDIANWRLRFYLLPDVVGERYGGPGAKIRDSDKMREHNAARVLEDGGELSKPLLDLPDAKYKAVNETLRAQDRAGRDFTDAELSKRGLDAKQIEAVHAARATLDYYYQENKAAEWYRFDREPGDQATLAADVAGRVGQKPADAKEAMRWAKDEILSERLAELDAQKRKGYLPRSRNGDYAVVHVKDTAGESTYYARAENAMHLDDIIADVKKRGLPYDPATDKVLVSSLDKDARAAFGALDGLSVPQLRRLAEAGVKDAATLLGDKVEPRWLKSRADHEVPGYGNDSRKLLADYGSSVARRRASSQWRMETNKIREDLKDPAKEKRENIRNFWRDHLEDADRPVTVLDKAGHLMRSLVFMRFLGGSTATALANTSSLVTHVGPTLAYHAGDGAAALQLAAGAIRQIGNYNSIRHLARSLKSSDPALSQALLDNVKGGSLADWGGMAGEVRADAGRLREGAHSREIAVHGAKQGLKKLGWLAGFQFQMTEKLVRASSFVAAFKIAKSKAGDVQFWRRAKDDGFKGKETPAEYAAWLVDKTSFRYDATNRSAAAKIPLAGPVLAGLQQFSLATLQLMGTRLRATANMNGGLTPRDRAAAAASLAKMGLGAGALGGLIQMLPFTMMTESLAQAFGIGDKDDPLKEKLYRLVREYTGSETAGKIARDGALAAIPTEEGSKIDQAAKIAQRGGMGNFGVKLNPQSVWETFPFISAVGGMGRDVRDATKAASLGEGFYSAIHAVNPALAEHSKKFGARPPDSRGIQTKGGMQVRSPDDTSEPSWSRGFLGPGLQESRKAELPRIAKTIGQGVDEDRHRFVVRLVDQILAEKPEEVTRLIQEQAAEDEKTGDRLDRRILTPAMHLAIKAEVMKRLAPEHSWMRSMSPAERIQFLRVQELRREWGEQDEDTASPDPQQSATPTP